MDFFVIVIIPVNEFIAVVWVCASEHCDLSSKKKALRQKSNINWQKNTDRMR